MKKLTPTAAYEFARNLTGVIELLKDDGVGHRKHAYRLQFRGKLVREIAIASRGTNDGVTIYINKLSCAGDGLELEDVRKRFPGVKALDEYPRGYVGKTGDVGLSSAAASCPSLQPKSHDVLRLCCQTVEGFRRLLDWYSGGAISEPETAPPASTLNAPMVEPVRSEQVDGTALALPASLPSPCEDLDPAGRLADPIRRRAVERHAVELAKAHYEALGYLVTELGKPYDLFCALPSESNLTPREIHVEVKGSTTSADTLHLTRNEVEHARETGECWRTDLFVVRNILMTDSSDSSVAATGGEVDWRQGWAPDVADLTPTDFSYRWPAKG